VESDPVYDFDCIPSGIGLYNARFTRSCFASLDFAFASLECPEVGAYWIVAFLIGADRMATEQAHVRISIQPCVKRKLSKRFDVRLVHAVSERFKQPWKWSIVGGGSVS
jgi:hypothetical protein